MKENNKNYEILAPINHMRLRKRMYLPCELIGKNSESKTKKYREEMEQSCIRWSFKMEEAPNPSEKTKKIWKEFIEWLSTIEVKIRVDFLKCCSYKYEILTNKNYVQINMGKNH